MVKRRLKAAFVSISEGIEIFCFFTHENANTAADLRLDHRYPISGMTAALLNDNGIKPLAISFFSHFFANHSQNISKSGWGIVDIRTIGLPPYML